MALSRATLGSVAGQRLVEVDLDYILVKTRDTGVVRAKAVYLALGINMAGE
jgi:transposase-like protein